MSAGLGGGMSPALLDEVRGSANEDRFRGGWDELRAHPSLSKWVERAQARLASTDVKQYRMERRPDPMLPPVILGTYRWKYNTFIPNSAGAIDTAEGYGYGRCEELLGEVRDDARVLTKVARTHMSAASVLRAHARSVQRLGRRPWVYQVHWPNPAFPVEGTAEGIRKVMTTGGAHHWGVCNMSVCQLVEYERHVGLPCATSQVRLNLAEREALRYHQPWCRDHGITVLAYSPLGQDFRALRRDYGAALDRIAGELGCTAAQVALRWVISHSNVHAIVATNDAAHWVENLEAGRMGPLPPNYMEQL